MTTIFERAATALATLGVPYANQVYIPATGTDLPNLFLVFFLVTAPTAQHADDAETLRTNRVQVTTYSRTGLVSLPDVTGAMEAAGFTPAAKYQLAYNLETRHFGLATDYIYLEES
jgi:hypothetical protein